LDCVEKSVTGRLGPVEVRVVEGVGGETAAVAVGVPADEELSGVALEPAVGGGAAEGDDRCDEDETAATVGYASL